MSLDHECSRLLSAVTQRLGLSRRVNLDCVEKMAPQRDLTAICKMLAACRPMAVALILDAPSRHLGGVLLDPRRRLAVDAFAARGLDLAGASDSSSLVAEVAEAALREATQRHSAACHVAVLVLRAGRFDVVARVDGRPGGGGPPERPADHLPDGRATGRELVLWQPPDQRDPLALPALEAAAWASPLAAARVAAPPPAAVMMDTAAARVAAPPPAAVMMDTGAVVARPTKRRLSWEEADGLQHRKRVRPLEGSTSPNIILPRRSPGTTKRRSFAADPPFDRPAKRPCVAAHC